MPGALPIIKTQQQWIIAIDADDIPPATSQQAVIR